MVDTVNTLVLLLVVVVAADSVQDRDVARLLVCRLGGVGKKLRKIWVDGGYQGKLPDWVAQRFRFRLHLVKRPKQQKGFAVLPRRWVVECTFAWLSQHRRFSKDHERLTESSDAFIYIPMTGLLLRRLARH